VPSVTPLRIDSWSQSRLAAKICLVELALLCRLALYFGLL
jgi:hypothetical protein